MAVCKSKLQELIHKSQNGFELSDKECEALGQYLLDNPNSKLYKNGVRALQKEIDGKLEKNNFLAEIIDALFGSVHTTGIDGSLNRNTSFWSSSYIKYNSVIEVDEDGIFKGKFHNGAINGLAIDLKILSLEADVTDWHLNIGSNVAIPFTNNKFGLNADLGINTSTKVVEMNASASYGDDKSDNSYGVKISPDYMNGLLGFYGKTSNVTKINNKSVKKSELEEGFQILNWPTATAIGLAPIVGPMIVPVLAKGATVVKIGELGAITSSAIWIMIQSFFNDGGKK